MGLKKCFFATVVTVGSMASSFAAEGVTSLPDTGVDVSSFISLGITALGGVVAVALGGYVAFLLVKKALKWIGKALS